MRALLTAGALGLALSLALTPIAIRLFRRWGWGQFIREDGPKHHATKKGTPTKGGLVFILTSWFGYLGGLYLNGEVPTVSGLLVLGLMTGLGAVGFIDDFLKTHKSQNLGLNGWWKVLGQCIVATGFAFAAFSFPNSHGVTGASGAISLVRDTDINLFTAGPVIGMALVVAWIAIITVSTSNGVNLTDGLDGLATGATIIALGSYIVIGFWQFNQSCFGTLVDAADLYRCYPTRDPLDLAIVATAILGSLAGFLWWNTSPAQIMMGDSGSLSLGGALSALAVLTHTELLLILIGGLYVIEAGSVILQRAYFKATKGRRIFLMSPIHHHFELRGWHEVTIVVRFWIVAALFAAAGVGMFYIDWLRT